MLTEYDCYSLGLLLAILIICGIGILAYYSD